MLRPLVSQQDRENCREDNERDEISKQEEYEQASGYTDDPLDAETSLFHSKVEVKKDECDRKNKHPFLLNTGTPIEERRYEERSEEYSSFLIWINVSHDAVNGHGSIEINKREEDDVHIIVSEAEDVEH